LVPNDRRLLVLLLRITLVAFVHPRGLRPTRTRQHERLSQRARHDGRAPPCPLADRPSGPSGPSGQLAHNERHPRPGPRRRTWSTTLAAPKPWTGPRWAGWSRRSPGSW